MEFLLLNQELSEARLFRASRNFGSLTSREIANLLYLETMITYMLAQEEDSAEQARDYAKRTSQYGTYSLFRTHATDLYMLAYQVLHPTNDYAKIKDPVDGKRFLSNLPFNKQMHIRFMRKIAQTNEEKGEAITYFYRLEKQLQISDGRYRGWRRMIGDWRNLRYSSKQRVLAQIIQELRRTGSGAAQYTELMRSLTPMLKKTRFKNRDIVPDEKTSFSKKVAGAVAGGVAGRYAADKINKTDNKTAKTIGTGIGAVAGYWAAGRKQK